jgi:hypothetical protein
MPYTPVPVVTPVIISSRRCETQPPTPPSPTEAMAAKVVTFSFVAFMVLIAATMLASAVAIIRDEGWDWLSTLWLCAAVTMAVAVAASGVLVLA